MPDNPQWLQDIQITRGCVVFVDPKTGEPTACEPWYAKYSYSVYVKHACPNVHMGHGSHKMLALKDLMEKLLACSICRDLP